MSYTALYRKFRPALFSDVKGQDHIVTTLKNQIRTGRIGHAYLFTGTRGTYDPHGLTGGYLKIYLIKKRFILSDDLLGAGIKRKTYLIAKF